MKKLWLLVVVGALVCLSAQVQADDFDHRLGIREGVVVPFADKFHSNYYTELVYSLKKGDFGLDLAGGYTRIGIQGDGWLRTVPLTATVKLYVGDTNPEWYIGSGVGYYVNSYQENDTLRARALANGYATINLITYNEVGFHLQSGWEYKTENWTIGLLGRYVFSGDLEIRSDVPAVCVAEGETNLKSVWGMFEGKYRF